MICQLCNTSFLPKVLRTIEPKRGEGNDIEVQTRCPKCKEVFYTFTDSRWTSLSQVEVLIRKTKKGTK